MPETAKILSFPVRKAAPSPSREEVLDRAKAYLAGAQTEEVESTDALGDADVLLSICSLLRTEANTSPSRVADEASAIYRRLVSAGSELGFFDERDYFLGESALIAGGCHRLLGHRDETELWLDRAEASFRHTLNPSPMLARVAYIRLAMRYDVHRYDDVLELLPSVALTFEKLGMDQELSKCRFLEAVTLKVLGQDDAALVALDRLTGSAEGRCEDAIRGMALVNLGELHGKRGAFDKALAAYRSALPILQRAQRFIALADLKAVVGDTLRRMGRVESSLQAYREAINDYSSQSVKTRAAYIRIVLAEALLQAGRITEAEWEVRAALPTIREEQMVPEGFVAMTLLQESLNQRRTDPKALLEVREYLQAKN